MTAAKLDERDILEDFVVAWTGDTLCAEFTAWEIVGRCDDGSLMFVREGADDSGDTVDRAEDGEVYMRGFIKWDACSHVFIGDPSNGGYLHLCGRSKWLAHIKLMAHLWSRAGQLLNAENALDEFLPIQIDRET